MMSICNKQHLATFEAQFIKQLRSIEVESKKCVAYKKKLAMMEDIFFRR